MSHNICPCICHISTVYQHSTPCCDKPGRPLLFFERLDVLDALLAEANTQIASSEPPNGGNLKGKEPTT